MRALITKLTNNFIKHHYFLIHWTEQTEVQLGDFIIKEFIVKPQRIWNSQTFSILLFFYSMWTYFSENIFDSTKLMDNRSFTLLPHFTASASWTNNKIKDRLHHKSLLKTMFNQGKEIKLKKTWKELCGGKLRLS